MSPIAVFDIYHPRIRVGNVFGRVCLSVGVSVCLCVCLFKLVFAHVRWCQYQQSDQGGDSTNVITQVCFSFLCHLIDCVRVQCVSAQCASAIASVFQLNNTLNIIHYPLLISTCCYFVCGCRSLIRPRSHIKVKVKSISRLNQGQF